MANIGIYLRALLAGGRGYLQGQAAAEQMRAQQAQQDWANQLQMGQEQRQAELAESTIALQTARTEALPTWEEKTTAEMDAELRRAAAGEAAEGTARRGELETQARFLGMPRDIPSGPEQQYLYERPLPRVPITQPLTLQPGQPPGLEGMFAQPQAPGLTPAGTYEQRVGVQPTMPLSEIPTEELERAMAPYLREAGVRMGPTGLTVGGAPAEAPSVETGRQLKNAIARFDAFGVPPGMKDTPLWMEQELAKANLKTAIAKSEASEHLEPMARQELELAGARFDQITQTTEFREKMNPKQLDAMDDARALVADLLGTERPFRRDIAAMAETRLLADALARAAARGEVSPADVFRWYSDLAGKAIPETEAETIDIIKKSPITSDEEKNMLIDKTKVSAEINKPKTKTSGFMNYQYGTPGGVSPLPGTDRWSD